MDTLNGEVVTLDKVRLFSLFRFLIRVSQRLSTKRLSTKRLSTKRLSTKRLSTKRRMKKGTLDLKELKEAYKMLEKRRNCLFCNREMKSVIVYSCDKHGITLDKGEKK